MDTDNAASLNDRGSIDLPEELIALAVAAQKVTVLSGAGISAESGVPTFREAQTGLWERFSAEDLATPAAFDTDPDLVWTWYRWRQSLINAVDPNLGHQALARWQRHLGALELGREAADPGSWLAVSTQNVDDLHERAGAQVMAHLHGSIVKHLCTHCGEPAVLPEPGYDGFTAPPGAEPPPECEHCGSGVLRPGIVLFGEMLPTAEFEATSAAVRASDLVIVVGTSGIVYPAAGLPLAALERGTPLVEINPEPTELSDAMDFRLRHPSGEALPALVDAVVARMAS